MNIPIKKFTAGVFIVGLMLTTTSPAFARTASVSSSSSHSSSSSTHASSSTATHAASTGHTASATSASSSSSTQASISVHTTPTSHVSGPVAQGPTSVVPSMNIASIATAGMSTFNVMPAANVTATSADLNVDYVISRNDQQAGGVDLVFVYDTTSNLNFTTSPQTPLYHIANGASTYTYTLAGLSPNTTYYYRILGNGFQYSYIGSVVQSFTTGSSSSTGASVFNVLPATNVTQTGADLNLSYTISAVDALNGGVDVKFVYDTTPNLNFLSSPSTAFTMLASGSGTLNSTITGLTPNTTYYYRILGNGFQYSYTGSQLQSFTTGSVSVNAPIMTTTAATGITNTAAQLNGTYDANGSASTIWFEYGTTPALGSATTVQNVTANATGAYNAPLASLTANTTYYFRAAGTNTFGTTYGTTMSFTTTNSSSSSTSSGGGGGSGVGIPDITTNAATNVTDIHATLNGHYNANGLATTTWFELSKNESDLAGHTATIVDTESRGTGIADFSAAAPALTAGTTYYYRAVAENSKGTVYGNTKTFTTAGTMVTDFTALTSLATSISLSGATLNGLVQNGNHESIKAYFEYGTSASALTQSTDVKSLGSSAVIAMNANVSGLAADTMYYYRAVAEDANGISRGEIRIFKTSLDVIDQNAGPVAPSTTVTGTSSKFIDLSITDQSDEVAAGDAMSYAVTFKNKTDKDIANTVVEISLPNEVAFVKASDGQFDSARNTLVINVGSFGSNVEGKVTIDAKVTNDAASKDFLLTNAVAKYTNPETTGTEEAIAYVVNKVNKDNANGLGAASIFGDGSFLPNTLVGWLSLILVLGGLVFIGRHVYVGAKRREEPTQI